MNLWEAIVQEALDDRTLVLIAGLIVTALLVRVGAKGALYRVPLLLRITTVHLILVPATAIVHLTEPGLYGGVRFATLLVGAVAGVGMIASVAFLVVLPRVGVEVPRILQDMVVAVMAFVAMLAVATKVGFNLSGLIATSAVLTAVIGFSLQDTLGNIMGGLALQLDNSIKVGDWVKVNDISGRVTEIGWRRTAVETRNWETLIVPNGVLMKSQVLVLGRRTGQPPYWRRWVYFNVDYRYQPSDVIACVHEALTTRPIERVAKDPPPNVIAMDLHESYTRFAVRYWLTDLAVDDPTDSVVRTRIYFALRRAGIPIAMPAYALFVTEESSKRAERKSKQEHDRRLKALRTISLFEKLSTDELDHLADTLRYAPFTNGEVLTRQGAEAHWLYTIIEGEASVRVADDEGHEKEVARLKAGSFFGEMSLLTGAPRAATVIAVGDVECYRVDKAAVKELFRAHPELLEHVAQVVAKRRMELDVVREGLGAEETNQRLAAQTDDLLDKIRDFFGLHGG